uniref:30S ribosomal protein S7 n=1 Tax=Anthurium amnicola TaxID=1678845 RepID=A0A1D1XKP1_9ARAE
MASAPRRTHEISRRDIQEAIARAAELRALHVALLRGGSVGSSATRRAPVEPSPSLPTATHRVSSGDYPVFTPGYEEEPLPACHYFHSESQTLLETFSTIGLKREEEDGICNLLDDEEKANFSSMSRKDQMLSTADGKKSYPSSCTNCAALEQTSPGTDTIKSTRRSGSEEYKVVTICNKCKPATISRVTDNGRYKSPITAVHTSNTHQSSLQLPQSNRRAVWPWLFPLKRKAKSGISVKTIESEAKPQMGICSLETLKKELIDAFKNRDAAMSEVGEMTSSLKELKEKLTHLEAYCEELKKALKQTMRGKDAQFVEKRHLRRRTKSIDSSIDGLIPVGHEVMLEGFLQMVSEARLSVKELCKTLISHAEEFDIDLLEKLNKLIQPNNLTMDSRCRYPKALLYHLEALISQTLYQDFENCVFLMNGSQKILDPMRDCLENFSAFVTLRSLSWKEALTMDSQYYSMDLSNFCYQKMSSLVSVLDWSRPWPDQLRQSFFVAAKCIWLLHLLAFSFTPPLAILRVGENRKFDPLYMEDILSDRQGAQAPADVKIMVMPGFYVQDRVVRCKVLCSYRSF